MANLTPLEVAKRLNLSDTTIKTYCKQGVFPQAFLIMKHWRIPESDVERIEKRPVSRPVETARERSNRLNVRVEL